VEAFFLHERRRTRRPVPFTASENAVLCSAIRATRSVAIKQQAACTFVVIAVRRLQQA